MAKTRKLTATAPDGSLFTRTTARTYTHVVAYTYDAAKREAFDTLKDWVINEAKNWAYDAKIAQHGDGTVRPSRARLSGAPRTAPPLLPAPWPSSPSTPPSRLTTPPASPRAAPTAPAWWPTVGASPVGVVASTSPRSWPPRTTSAPTRSSSSR
jgi:hypothetical protein